MSICYHKLACNICSVMIVLVATRTGFAQQIALASADARLDEVYGYSPMQFERPIGGIDDDFDPYMSTDSAADPQYPISIEPVPICTRVASDYQNFYRRDSLMQLGAGLAVGALMANTNIDHEIHRKFQSSIRNANSDDWFEYLHASKELGNPYYTIPVVASAWFAGSLLEDHGAPYRFLGDWGERSVRGYLVGIPHALAFQSLTGGSRPDERNYKSHWRPFADDNGLSGHSFVSALPFITAAKLTRRPVLKGAFYFASAMGPLSRVNDDAHYPSQAFLGWWLAYVAASAVEHTDNSVRPWNVMPYADRTSTGIAAEFRY